MNAAETVTSALLWRATLVAAAIDLPLLWLAARLVAPSSFATLKWYLAGAAFVVYTAIWAIVASWLYWDEVYGYLFPAWSRWWLPPFYGAAYGGLAFLFWAASRRARRWPALWFCVLGGLVSIPGHAWGIRRGLLTVPMLEQASVASALVFGVFEFIVYWFAILWLAIAARRLSHRSAADRKG